ncbi:hypothetical protein ACH4OY_24480 [Micromonospora rubida]|uniref:Peptidase M23 domain-containing protein n=1 Tax=Micromonospora rubida TaxID=2697657 RepID=A0ABW7SQ48_9ACTN
MGRRRGDGGELPAVGRRELRGTAAVAGGVVLGGLFQSAPALAALASGAIVGRSGGAAGAPGSGSSTGPHLHWHMIDPAGRRTNPLAYVNPSPPIDLWKDGMRLIQSTNRGIALVGPGYFRQLSNNEEVVAAVALVGDPLIGNDRQFDLWRSIAFDGQVKAPS